MSISSNSLITYHDLFDLLLSWIVANIQNGNSTKYNTLPACLKAGYSYEVDNHAYNAGGHNPWDWWGKNRRTHYVITATDNFVYYFQTDAAATELISDDLSSFLSSRDIESKSDQIITLVGFLNWYNNIASYLAAKLIYTSGLICANKSITASGKYLVFNCSDVDTPRVISEYPVVPVIDTQLPITVEEAQELVENIIVLLKEHIKVKPVTYSRSLRNT